MLVNCGTVEEGAIVAPATLTRLWTPGDMVLGIIVASIGTGLLILVLSVGLAITRSNGMESESTRLAAALAAVFAEGFLGLWVVARRRARGFSWAALGFVVPRRWGPLWVAWAGSYLILIGYTGLLALLQWFGIDVSRFSGGNTVPLDPSDGSAVLLLLAVAVVGMAPLCEELFFRAMLFRGLRGYWSLTPALLASGLLFGLFHFNIGVLLPFTLIGVVFAWSNEQSGSIYTSIAAHGAVNSLSFLLTAAWLAP
ncbi:MAG: CPBP family intramembrane metalloprotease [Dehalococcoidia bacterium]|nr:CPBP family intramembrane metalloprotease [Dehalococcoidia bacterium]